MGDERILVVDDEPSVVRFCARLLTEKGYQVHSAGGGREALDQLERERFDLLLLDLMMTDVDGLTVLRRARELDPQAAAIIITGYGTIENAIEALRAGARDLVLKPFAPPDLLSAVAQALEEQRREQENLLLRTRLPILEISQALMTEGEPGDLAQQLLEVVVRQVSADRATLLLLDEEGNELRLVGAVGIADLGDPARFPVGQGLIRQALQQEKPLTVDGTAPQDPPLQALGLGPAAAVACVPLHARKGAIGVLILGRSDGMPFDANELNLLSIAANQVTIALDNAHLYEVVARGKREWETTFDAMDDWVCLANLDGRILRTNRVGTEFTDVSLKEMIGQTCCALIHGSETPLPGCPLQQMIRTGQRESQEYYNPDRDRWLLITVDPVLDGDGTLVGAVHTARNVTATKRAEEAIRESEEKFRSVIEQSSDGIVLIDRQGTVVEWNQGQELIFGLKRSQVLDLPVWEVHEQLRASVLELLETGQTPRADQLLEREIQRPDGQRRIVLTAVFPIQTAQGRMVGSVSRDITERKVAEEALRREKEFTELLINSSMDGILAFDHECRYTVWNPGMERISGVSRADVVGQNAFQAFPFLKEIGEDRFFLEALAGEIVTAENRPYTIPGTGRKGFFEGHYAPLRGESGEVIGGLAVIHDITRRIQAEEELHRLSEELLLEKEKLEDVVQGVGAGLVLLDDQGRIVWANEILQEWFGPLAQWEGRPACDLYQFEDPETECNALRALRSGQMEYGEAHVRDAQGNDRHFQLVAMPLKGKDGKIAQIVELMLDITERKQMEVALRQERNFATSLVDTAQAIVLVLDTQGRIVHFNPYVETLTGYRLDEVQGQDWFATFLPQRDHERVRKLFLETVDDIQTRGNVNPIVTKDGRELEIEWYDKTLKDADGHITGILAIGQDITEHKLAEEALERSREQLRALASYLQDAREEERTHVAREIHDEFGQALTALKMDLSWLIRRLPEDAVSLRDKAQSMSDLVDDTIHMVRRIATDLRPGLLDNLGLVAALEWQTREFQDRTGIACELYLPEDELDRDEQMDTVFFRIFQETLTNIARHANATEVHIDLKDRGSDRILTVRDDGRGITEDQVSDPRSLGLIGMRERVRPWGGQVVVQGVPGQGTTVTVRVPHRGSRARA